METVGGTATESVRLPPPWLRGGNVVPRIKSDDPYLQIVQPEGISVVGGSKEGERGAAGDTLEATSSPHDALGSERGGQHTTAHNTADSPESASVPSGETETPSNVATAWLENREEIHRCSVLRYQFLLPSQRY